MTATTPEAILKKVNNKKSKKDILKEKKIVELGGTAISVVYGFPLTSEEREQRTEYLFDLLYPKRREKKQASRGRPLKYLTEEDRKKANRDRARECYHATRGRNTVGTHWASRTPIYTMYMSAKTRAKKNNIPFDLTLDYLLKIFPEDILCPVLKEPFIMDSSTLVDMSPTLDRFIPELGYTIGNVTIISNKMNRMKNNGTEEELRKLLHWMRNK
jgi:hypothetical protein